MPFIPHTQQDIDAMLAEIDVDNLQQLFDEIPSHLKIDQVPNVAPGMTELEVTRFMGEKVDATAPGTCFIGAGAYEHHIPAAVWEITARGEFYSAYTPYQAEASQGTLQLIYEYQSIMTQLLGLDVSNASMYDGATALMESVLMAVRIKRGKARKVLVPLNINPVHRKVLQTFLPRQEIEIIDVPFSVDTGRIDEQALEAIELDGVAAFIIPQPNFFGVLEEVDTLANFASEKQLLSIAYVNPMAMNLLKPPGAWGDQGVDIACGEGQPMGVPLASGGPYFGFMCCRKEHVRQMPGRIVGRSEDEQGNTGYVLTLQAREQHIRRSKATSNICTNQGLMVTAATIYMSIMGAIGMREVALNSHNNTMALQQAVSELPGVSIRFSAPKFHEFIVQFEQPVADIKAAMSAAGLQAGFILEDDFPTLKNCLLVCATETKTPADLDNYVSVMASCLKHKESIAC